MLSRPIFGVRRIVLLGAALVIHPAVRAQEKPYRSPYRVEFTIPAAELVGDLERTDRGDRKREAQVPYQEWYSPRTLERWKGWGPVARTFPAPKGLEHWSTEQKRERVVAVAMRFIGYGYQHHHVPDWDPPSEFPWKPTCVGHNGPGVDCSNFTGFVYNLGLGLKINTNVHTQAEESSAQGSGSGHITPIRHVALPGPYQERIKTLRTGDLVYIRNRRGDISHVVIWIGPIGRSPDGVPLVIDSHGAEERDSSGQQIPCGIYIRPFLEKSWYNRSASHAHRIIAD